MGRTINAIKFVKIWFWVVWREWELILMRRIWLVISKHMQINGSLILPIPSTISVFKFSCIGRFKDVEVCPLYFDSCEPRLTCLAKFAVKFAISTSFSFLILCISCYMSCIISLLLAAPVAKTDIFPLSGSSLFIASPWN